MVLLKRMMLFLCLTGYELCQPIFIADVVKKKKN